MADVLIDLDRAEPAPPAVLDRPPWTRLSRGKTRVALVTAVVVLLALTSGAAAAPVPPRFPAPIHIPAAMSEDFALFDDGVLVRGSGGREVRSYGLDGRLRWSAPTRIALGEPLEVAGDVVLVPAADAAGHTVALDRHSGAVRWQAAGVLFGVTGDIAVLTVLGNTMSEDDVQRLSGVGVADGRQRWQAGLRLAADQRPLTVIAGDEPYSGWRRAGLGRVLPDGTGEFLDLETGVWRPVSGLPLRPTSRDSWYEYGVQVDGGYTVVFSSDRLAGGQVRVFGPGPGGTLWAAWTDHGGGSICGPWICVQHGDRTRVLDVRTGAEVRQADWPVIRAGSSRRLVGYSVTETAATAIAVLDATTGRIIRVYSGWATDPAPVGDWVPMFRRRGGLHWQLASVRLRDGAAYSLGSFDPSGEAERACGTTRTHIACAVRTGGLLLWRYAPSAPLDAG